MNTNIAAMVVCFLLIVSNLNAEENDLSKQVFDNGVGGAGEVNRGIFADVEFGQFNADDVVFDATTVNLEGNSRFSDDGGETWANGNQQPDFQLFGFEEVLGDIDCDGVVNLLDVKPFIDSVSLGEFSGQILTLMEKLFF